MMTGAKNIKKRKNPTAYGGDRHERENNEKRGGEREQQLSGHLKKMGVE